MPDGDTASLSHPCPRHNRTTVACHFGRAIGIAGTCVDLYEGHMPQPAVQAHRESCATGSSQRRGESALQFLNDQFRELDGIECRALAQIVANNEHGEATAALYGLILPNTTHV